MSQSLWTNLSNLLKLSFEDGFDEYSYSNASVVNLEKPWMQFDPKTLQNEVKPSRILKSITKFWKFGVYKNQVSKMVLMNTRSNASVVNLENPECNLTLKHLKMK